MTETRFKEFLGAGSFGADDILPWIIVPFGDISEPPQAADDSSLFL